MMEIGHQMQDECKHERIEPFASKARGEPAELWACASCLRKFVPLDLETEADAARYRWLVGNYSTLGFSGAPSWAAVVTIPAHADDSTLTEIIDRARLEGPQ